MLCLAYAKVNLTLDVLGRRPDGYHDLRSVMQTVSLADALDVEVAPDLSLEVDLDGGVTTQPDGFAGPHNLVWRAAEELRRRSGYRGGARLRLRKRIPVAAGLGGGSSDAAATLLTLNALWGLDLPRAALAPVAAALGSDVPFFLWGGTAAVSGRGEYVQPLAFPGRAPGLALVLARPPIAVATARVFGALPPDHYTTGAATDALVAAVTSPGPPVPLGAWPLSNALQQTTCRLYPVVREVLAALGATGPRRVLMSGSGPTCFALYLTEGEAAQAAAHVGRQGWEAWAVTTVAARHAQDGACGPASRSP